MRRNPTNWKEGRGVRRISPAFLFMAFLLAFLFSSSALAFQVPSKPTTPIYDGADVLTPDQEVRIVEKLESFEEKYGPEIGVAILPSLEGQDIRELGYEIAQTWGIGERGKNNGVLLLIGVEEARKAGPGATKCGCAAIEVGEYLEGDLTDAISVSILKKEVLEAAVSGDFYAAVGGGVAGIMAVLSGDADAAQQYTENSFGLEILFWIFLLALLILFALAIGPSSGGSSKGYGSFGSSGGGFGGGGGGGGGSFGGGGGSI
jgi:uncharacterized protein